MSIRDELDADTITQVEMDIEHIDELCGEEGLIYAMEVLKRILDN